jgi:tRNA pseudouridine55 synthase
MGVLPVFVGRATRMVEYHLADEKAYRASVVLGASSSTDDLDGEMTPGDVPAPDRDAVIVALAGFLGPIEQVPPDHSAVHVGGRRAYELARGGQKPELASREVTIHALELVAWDATDPARPLAELEVRCSAGTYVRSLARDLGQRLGCGAYLGALVRTASGPFRLEDATPLDAVREVLAAGRTEDLLLPSDVGLEHIPALTLAADDRDALARGQVVRVRGQAIPAPPQDGAAGVIVRVLDADGRLVAMAHVQDGRLHPEKVFIAPGA